jgi:hypothetical protein
MVYVTLSVKVWAMVLFLFVSIDCQCTSFKSRRQTSTVHKIRFRLDTIVFGNKEQYYFLSYLIWHLVDYYFISPLQVEG